MMVESCSTISSCAALFVSVSVEGASHQTTIFIVLCCLVFSHRPKLRGEGFIDMSQTLSLCTLVNDDRNANRLATLTTLSSL